VAKKEFALTFFHSYRFKIYHVQNEKFILGCHNLACYWQALYLFLDSALFPAELNLLCCINISLMTP